MIDKDAEVKIPLRVHAAIRVVGRDVHGDGNHLRGFAELAFDGAVAILLQGAYDFGGVAHFGGLVRRRESGNDLVFGQRHFHGAEVEHGMAECEDALAVVIRDSAAAGH